MSMTRPEDREAEAPWQLPAGRAWADLCELGVWTGGGTPSKANPDFWRGGSVPWVSPKDMKADTIGETEDFITEDAVANSAAKYVAASSVLMVMRSGILRHTFPVASNDRIVTLNQDLRALTPYGGIQSTFVARYLKRLRERF
jgi:type I restriction enzyme, S subunit